MGEGRRDARPASYRRGSAHGLGTLPFGALALTIGYKAVDEVLLQAGLLVVEERAIVALMRSLAYRRNPLFVGDEEGLLSLADLLTIRPHAPPMA